MELQWRPGSQHRLADALSRSHGSIPPCATVGDSFPGDILIKGTYRGPQRPVLNGVLLSELGVDTVNNDLVLPLTVLAALAFTPDSS